ncbi:MAG TPA: folate-binding protein [Alphaproteobacteria bacterium]|nr:folate-binding protein [Alphaproteobacteria bacterium]
MSEPAFAILDSRAVLAVGGEDRVAFLQGLVSTDVASVSAAKAIHTAFLTAQGKYLHDFFIAALGDGFLLDCEAARLEDLKKRLSIYRLRSKVTIEARPDLAVAVVFGAGGAEALRLAGEAGAAGPLDGGVGFVDPRLADAGARAVLPADSAAATLEAAGLAAGSSSDYDRLRLSLGLPDGSRDLVPEKSILLENGFDELNGVDWDKGCFLGQELTARTHYRGLVKKRLMPVAIDGPLPAPGTLVMLGEKEAGEMRSGTGTLGLALLRLEAVERAAAEDLALMVGDARLAPKKPAWATF